MSTQIHETAMLEPGVECGDGTRVWDNVHIRAPARIGRDCIIGEKSYIAYDVVIGNRVKVNAFVYLCTGVELRDGVMVSAGTVFTNDRFPRATTPDLQQLRSSDPDEDTLPTIVHEGATVGAGCTIGCGFNIGRFAMVGMGAVVTRAVPGFHLVVGNPARSVGIVCRCGEPIQRFGVSGPIAVDDVACTRCGLRYAVHGGVVTELTPPPRTPPGP